MNLKTALVIVAFFGALAAASIMISDLVIRILTVHAIAIGLSSYNYKKGVDAAWKVWTKKGRK